MNELRNDFAATSDMSQDERDIWLNNFIEWHDVMRELSAPCPYFKTVQHDHI